MAIVRRHVITLYNRIGKSVIIIFILRSMTGRLVYHFILTYFRWSNKIHRAVSDLGYDYKNKNIKYVNCILFIFIICFCKWKGYPVNKKVNSFSNASLEKIGCFSVGTLTKLLDDTSVLVLTWRLTGKVWKCSATLTTYNKDSM